MLRDHAGVYELFLAYPACIKIHKVIQKPFHFSRNSGELNCLCYGDLTQNFRDYTYFKLIPSSQSAVSLSKLSSTSRVLNISKVVFFLIRMTLCSWVITDHKDYYQSV